MSNENADNLNDDPTLEKVSESEIILSRIVDHQATEQDHLRFEQLATDDSSLWRTLAQQQQEMAALGDTVIEHLIVADNVELPADTPASRASTITHKTFAFIGWAAAILIASVWFMLPAKESRQQIIELTHDEHLDEYRKADFIKQEYDPVLFDWERLDDERIRIFYMRRFEESVVTDRPLNEILDGDKFKVEPEELRNETSQPPRPNDQ